MIRSSGSFLGISRAADIVWVKNSADKNPSGVNKIITERFLEGLVRVLSDVVAYLKTARGKTILNMSFGSDEASVNPPRFLRMLCKCCSY